MDPLDEIIGKALNDMLKQPGMTLSAMRVYARLVRTHGPAIYERGFPAKEWKLARDLKMDRKTIRCAVHTLTQMGYLTECGRGFNKTRIVMASMSTDAPSSQAA